MARAKPSPRLNINIEANIHPAALSVIGKVVKGRPNVKAIMDMALNNHPASCRAALNLKTKH